MNTLFEWFAGVGGFREGFNMADINFNTVGISEYDKFAIKSYNAMYGVTENYGDINSIITVPQSDIWTYGFPCQDISIAGKEKGIKEGTRSGLLLRFEQILKRNIEIKQSPKILILENVKNLIGKNHINAFENWLEELEKLGYTNYWKVLNSKDYGLPHNRERVFCISIRDDIDKGFEFPSETILYDRLKDVIDEKVEKKYFLSDAQIEKIHYFSKETFELKVNRIANIYGKDKGTGYAGNVWDKNGLCPTLTTMQGGNRQPMILVDGKIRKITPKECFKLQGFKSELFSKAEKVNSDSQLYKQAGNSVSTTVICGIALKLKEFGYL